MKSGTCIMLAVNKIQKPTHFRTYAYMKFFLCFYVNSSPLKFVETLHINPLVVYIALCAFRLCREDHALVAKGCYSLQLS
jgi:hypothetical protein